MLKRLRQLAVAGAHFAFGSTLSSRTFAPFLRNLKAQGYSVAIYYFALTNAQLAVRRVRLRVALGGNHVPTDVVERRFARSISNFFTLYAPIATEWTLLNNSNAMLARPVAIFSANQLIVTEAPTWQKLQKQIS